MTSIGVREPNGDSMDEIDKKILEALKENSRSSYKDISRGVRISDVAVHKRIKKLKGVIRRFTVLVDQKAMEKQTTALIMFKCEVGKTGDIAQQLAKIDDIYEVYTTIGEHDIIAKVRIGNTDELKRLVEREISTIKGLNEMRTSIAFECFKEDLSLVM